MSRAVQSTGRGGDRAVIEIDSQEVEGSTSLLHVAGLDAHQAFGQKGESVWVPAAQCGIQEPAIDDRVSPFSRQLVCVGTSCRLARRHVQDGTYPRSRLDGFECAKTLAQRYVDHVGSAQEVDDALAARSEGALQIADVHECGRLIEEHPVVYAIAKGSGDQLHVIAVAAHQIAIGPASSIFKRLR